MRIMTVTGLLSLALVAGCGSSSSVSSSNAGLPGHEDHVKVCTEQNAMAKAGTVDGYQMRIWCPQHGIEP
jgi:hypothetical protein